MNGDQEVGPVSDASRAETMTVDPNGASTAVGTRHPESRRGSGVARTINAPDVELSDYDRPTPPREAIPADEDAGRSFTGIVDMGEDREP